MPTSIKRLALEQMDARLPLLREAAEELRRQTPRSGWVKAIRSALGMSDRSFAKRLGIQHGSMQELERNEQKGSVTLGSLRRAAAALDADLVYAIVPRKSLRATVSDRARTVAVERLQPIAHSMVRSKNDCCRHSNLNVKSPSWPTSSKRSRERWPPPRTRPERRHFARRRSKGSNIQ